MQFTKHQHQVNGSSSWYFDYSDFPGGGGPFFGRGGAFWDGDGAGLFYFPRHSGDGNYGGGFRAVLVDGIDWEKAKANAKAPAEQIQERNKGVIGIGTDGKPVNMDLWEYTYISSNDSYALNDSEVINNSGIENKGYLGKFYNGEIDGSVPNYIKGINDNEFKPVTDMNNTFRECNELIISPKIPETVTTMFTTFNSCVNLKIPPELPTNLENMYGLFYNCNSLEYSPEFPDTVLNMANSFVFCKKIESFPRLPSNVVELNGAFAHNPSLKKAPDIIPKSVEHMKETFIDCPNLEGTIEIDANPSIYVRCFAQTALYGKGLVLTGKSNILNELLNTKSANANIVLGSK